MVTGSDSVRTLARKGQHHVANSSYFSFSMHTQQELKYRRSKWQDEERQRRVGLGPLLDARLRLQRAFAPSASGTGRIFAKGRA